MKLNLYLSLIAFVVLLAWKPDKEYIYIKNSAPYKPAYRDVYPIKNTGGVSITYGNCTTTPIKIVGGGTTMLQPDDRVHLSGLYGGINMQEIPGAPGHEIIFVNDGQVELFGAYDKTPMTVTGHNFKLLMDLDLAYPHGMKIHGADSATKLSTCIKTYATTNATNFVLQGIEMYNAGMGITSNPSNPSLPSTIDSMFVINCMFHDFFKGTNCTAEGVYSGLSNQNTFNAAPRHTNQKILNCSFVNMQGDGAQLKLTSDFEISGCYFQRTGFAYCAAQGDAIQVGEFSWGKIENNEFVDFKQHAILFKGMDTLYIRNNIFRDANLSGPTNDMILISTLADVSKPLMRIYCYNNQILRVHAGRSLINNYNTNMTQQDSGYYYQNCDTSSTVGGTFFPAYPINGGTYVSGGSTVDNVLYKLKAKDRYSDCVNVPDTLPQAPAIIIYRIRRQGARPKIDKTYL